MRILHVIESLGRAGAEQALVNLLPEMQKRGHICEVAALWPPHDLADDLRASGIRVHLLHGRYERRWNAWRGVSRIAALARRRRIDVLHAHLLFADFAVGASKILAPRPRRVATLHNTDFDFLASSSPTSRIARHALPLCLRRGFDACAAVSTPVARHYEQHIPNLKATWIPNAFPTSLRPQPDVHRADVLAEFGIAADDFVIVVAARLAPEKGHQYLLDALCHLHERELRPRVLLLGDGPLRAELIAAVEQRKLHDQVVFCGNQPHSRLLPIVQCSDAFVLPSLLEGFPLAPAEAMALQTPVLATRAGGLTDLIENEVSGLLVPVGDAQALADGIARLMNDAPLRQRLGQQGRQRILEHFSSEVLAARWEQLYKSLLSAS